MKPTSSHWSELLKRIRTALVGEVAKSPQVSRKLRFEHLEDRKMLTTVSVDVSDSHASEPADVGEFQISRDESAGSLTVYYSMGGSASEGSDYSWTNGYVEFADGQSAATVTLNPIDDSDVEGDETATLYLSSNSTYTIGSQSASITIQDDDVLPSVSVQTSDNLAAEPSDVGEYQITRDNSVGSLTVYYSMSGDAYEGSDYSWMNGYVNFVDGQSSATVTLTPIDDSQVESDETATLTLWADSTYTLGSNSAASITIQDDDVVPTVSVQASDASASESGDSGEYLITRNQSQGTLLVSYSMGGSAYEGDDYSYLDGYVFFDDGQTSASVTLSPYDEGIIEGDETATLYLSADSAYEIGSSSSASITILDAFSSVATVMVDVSDSTASESGDAGEYQITRDSSQGSLWVYYYMSGGASEGSDYSNLNGYVYFADGQNSATVTLTPLDDSFVEGNETATLNLSADSSYNVGFTQSASITITDNDLLPTVSVQASDNSAAESGDTGEYTISRDSASGSLTVYYSMSGSADNGSDYSGLNGYVSFSDGQSSATITLNPIDDGVVEGDEAAILYLSSDSGYVIGSSSASIIILDAAVPTVSPDYSQSCQ